MACAKTTTFFRAYWKHAFLKPYEKFSRFLRHELCSNNLRDFALKKGLDHLDPVRKRFQIITDRFAGFQAQCRNVHVDFPLLQRIALPITIGAVRYPGIKLHDPRIIRLLEVLLHNSSTVGGWTAKQIHQAVLTTFRLSPKSYGLNQLRYDLRKLKDHALREPDGSRYAYRLTAKGVDVALLFLFFHKRLCGPLANSRFHHKPDPASRPNSKLESGGRSGRDIHAEELILRLLRIKAGGLNMRDPNTPLAALVVNDCAAATFLALNALAEGADVVVSRGELVEIGGGFRIPEILAKSGARMREVGTTNRTRLSDYDRAIQPETALILRRRAFPPAGGKKPAKSEASPGNTFSNSVGWTKGTH